MRKLFEIISIFDWITPTIALFEDVAEGGLFNLDAWTFYIPYEQAISKGWSGADIEALLAAYGIKSWGHLVQFGEFFFRVKLEQAAWAEYVLTRYAVPLQKKSQGAPHPRGQTSRRSKQRRPAPTRHALSFLDDFYDKYLPPPP